MARVTVGMPVYNGGAFVGPAIESILAQTLSDLELIISDNASTDGTEAVCRAYAARDSRVRYYRNATNRGGIWNFNQVFRLSASPYFKWAAHDDLCAPDFVEKCVDVLEHHPEAVLCYPRTIDIDANGNHLGEYEDGMALRHKRAPERFFKCLMTSSRCNPIFGVVRRDTLASTSLLGNFLANDYILLAELALRGQFYELPERLFFNRDHEFRAKNANDTLEKHLLWCDPSNTGRLPMRWSRLFVEYSRSIAHAPLGAIDKARCYSAMARWLWWKRTDIASEIVGSMTRRVQPASVG